MNVLDLFRLDGKTAVVTGGAQGLGFAMGSALFEAGAFLVIADINKENAEKACKEISPDGERVLAVACDVTDHENVKSTFSFIKETAGSLDILVNNAGIVYKPQVENGDASIPIEDTELQNWRRVMSVNLDGIFSCTQAAGKIMLEQGGGNIINISSMSGFIANWGRKNSAYCASKGGVVMFTREAATEWSEKGIRVNAIAPGYMKTAGAKALADPNVLSRIEGSTPMRRPGVPNDLKGLVVFLASDASEFITGQNIIIDGGYTLW